MASYVTPWTARVYDALPGNPLWIGLTFSAGLLTFLFIGRWLTDGGVGSSPGNLRIAAIHVLQATYGASAYVYALMTARQTTRDLAPVAGGNPQWQTIVQRAGTHSRWTLISVGLFFALVIGISVTNGTTSIGTDPWDWHSYSYDVFWHRVMTAFMIWWMGCLHYVIAVESIRLSRLSKEITGVDVLNLKPYQPLVRQGMTNALLIIGVASILSLLMVDSRYATLLISAWITMGAFAWIALMLPLRGIREKIRLAKAEELAWCSQAIASARDELKMGKAGGRSLIELTAYRTIIEDVRNWPFDNPTLARFGLYLLIPLGSWLGGAFVERGLDAFLS
jgi:hypothetical protein